MNPIHVTSEIGRLKTVMLHRPGLEIENLTPKWLEQLLFDDIPWLKKAQYEHDQLAKVFRQAGVKVVYLSDLVAKALDQSVTIKTAFIDQFIQEAHITSETLAELVKSYLLSFTSTKAMVEKTMGGILKAELPNFTKRTLSDYIRDYPFVTDPMPNLYFTRDPFSIIGEGVSISRMFTTTRSRETIYADYVFKYHPTYKRVTQHLYGRNEMSSIEGGDILVLSDKLIAVGVSQRTHPAAIEKLAKNLFYRYPTTFEKVLAFDIPKGRAFMHLDTVLTQVDVDKFAIHNELNHTIRIYECTRDPKREGKLVVKPIEQPLHKILETYLERKITLIPCGGSNIVNSDREQWSDGANMMAIAPGVVISYERNHITNALLKEHGITVYEIPSSELSRGRGGPRCMSMPLMREDLNDDTGGKKE